MLKSVLIFFFIFLLVEVKSQDTLIISIIDDQTSEVDSLLFNNLKKEIKGVVGSGTFVKFNPILNNNHDLIIAKQNYLKSVEKADIILSFGIANSVMLYREESYPKPTILIGAVKNEMMKTTSNNRSTGIDNLLYVVSPFSYEEDIEALNSLYRFKKIGIVIDEFYLNLFPLKKEFDLYFQGENSEYEFILYEEVDEIDSLFNDVDAVYYLSKNNMSDEEFQKMISIVNEKKLPSITSHGISEVEKGVLLSNKMNNNLERFFRRIALNVETIHDGENPANIEIELDYRKLLSINLETAKQIDLPVRNSMLGGLNLVEGTDYDKNAYTLVGLMKAVVGENLTLKSQKLDIDLSKQNVKTAKSNYLPNLSVNANATYTDPELAKISNGSRPELTTNGDLTLNQVLYSQSATTGILIKNEQLMIQKQVYSAKELDAILNASTAYINTLILKTNVIIQNKNLQLTRENLSIAKQNYELGASGKSDVLRFQSQISQNTKSLIFARNSLTQGYYQVNQLLNKPIAEKISVKDTLINTDVMENKTYQFLLKTLDDPQKSEVFTSFLIEEAKRNAPELKNIHHQLNVVENQRKLNGGGRFIPTVSLLGQYNYRFSRSGQGATIPSGFPIPPDGSYNAVLNLSLPIFQSNQRNINRQYAIIQQKQLGYNKENIELSLNKKIHDLVLNLVNEIADIEISAVNMDFAKESLELYQNEYKNGAIPVVQLIDAQNNYLNAYLDNAVAKYNYMLVSMRLQREISYFFLMKSEKENSDFIQRAKDYMWNH